MSTQRVKDASFIQLHIEKLILALGILIFVIAAAIFIVGKPFAVTLNGKTYDKPAQAIDILKKNDEMLSRGLSNPDPIPPVELPNFEQDFIAMLNVKPEPSRAMAGLGSSALTPSAIAPVPIEQFRYASVTPPTPQNIQHKFGEDVLDVDFNPEIVQGFFDLWGGEPETADFSMFIAAGDFPVAQWIERLRAPVVGSDVIPIPPGIWAQRFGIAGVALLREEWDPQAGKWTNRQIVQPLPGQQRVLPQDPAPTDPLDALANVQILREAQAELAKPELPWLSGFVQAVPPGGELGPDGQELGGDLGILNEEELGPAEQQIKVLEERIQQLEEVRNRLEERRRPRPGAGGGGGGELGPEGPGGGGGAPSGNDRLARQLESLKQKIAQLQPRAEREADERAKRAEVRARREAERQQREALLGARDRLSPGGLGEGDRFDGIDLTNAKPLRVWAADPTMKPGKTYRYKLLVTVINPLYAVPRLEPDQLDENRARAALLPSEKEIEAMPWIGPIKVETRTRFFFTNASEPRDSSPARAKIEVFRRINGVQHKETFDAEPGDTIGGVVTIRDKDGFEPDKSVDLGVDAVLVDIESRRDSSGNTGYAMIYMDASGQLHERLQSQDFYDPERKRLERVIKDGPQWPLRPTAEDESPAGFRDFPGSGGEF